MPNFFGGTGNDSFVGDGTNETIYGGGGNDTLYGGAGLDTIYGEDGNDRIDGGVDNDFMYGGAGDDTFLANFGTNEGYFGGTGNDVYQIAGTSVNGVAYSVNLEAGNDQFGRVFSGIETVLGGAGADTLTGRNDTEELLDGGGGSDQIYGGGGGDTLYGGSGTDRVYGGAGNDVINGGTQVDTLYGGLGDDVFVQGFEFGNDTIYGGEGDETLGDMLDFSTVTVGMNVQLTGSETGTATAVISSASFFEIERFNLTNNADTFVGAGSNDIVYGGLGNDTLTGNGGADQLYGGGGLDQLFGGDGNDLIDAGAGNDLVNYGAGDDTVYGGDGDDVIDDLGGIPFLVGNNLVFGGDGNDFVWDSTGNDTVYGGAGRDTLQGDNAGNDAYYGDDGNDSIFGGAGNDSLFGGADSDTVSGGDGRDVIDGGAGSDQLTGGAGADVFIVQGADTITDFDAATGVTSTATGPNTDNDFVDLSAFYNATTLAAWNAANPGNQYDNALKWLQADQADGILQSAGGLRIQNGGVAVGGAALNVENTAVCFAQGTRIATAKGQRRIEKLRVGDLVETADHGLQPIRWIGQMQVEARGDLAPILISAGALGNRRDIMVSPLHRMVLSGWQVELMFGADEVLAAAKMLVNGTTIRPVPMDNVRYYHIMFDAHEVVFAEGAGAESFHPGEEGFDSLGPDACAEIMALMPQLAGGNFAAFGPSARRSLRSHEARLLDMGRKLAPTEQLPSAPRPRAVAAR